MKNLLKKRLDSLKKKDKKGFTLVEMIVVLVILAIILAITVPAITGYIDEAKKGKYVAEARAVFMAAEVDRTYLIADGTIADNATDHTWTAGQTPDEFARIATDSGLTVKALDFDATNKQYVIQWESADGATVDATVDLNKNITIDAVN